MALIKCPECNKEISDRAKICPNCGFPIKHSRPSTEKETQISKKKVNKVILISIIGICLVITAIVTSLSISGKNIIPYGLRANMDINEIKEIMEKNGLHVDYSTDTSALSERGFVFGYEAYNIWIEINTEQTMELGKCVAIFMSFNGADCEDVKTKIERIYGQPFSIDHDFGFEKDYSFYKDNIECHLVLNLDKNKQPEEMTCSFYIF